MNLFDRLNLQQQQPISPAALPSPQTAASPVPLPVQPATATGAPSSPIAFQRGQPVGFFTDSTLCIGCKACEVACKQWNQLPANEGGTNALTGNSYDNTGQLDGINWRHVKFIEQFTADRQQGRWLMLSDVCKHCVQAGCLEVCPTGAIMRTEFDTVVIQSNVCNGCRDCIAACPFGVIEINPVNKTAQKCTLCYDRLQAGLTPACAQACPTASIQFGPIEELRRRADARVATLQSQNVPAYIYGDENMLGGLNAFSLLIDKPEVYGLPENPKMPSRNLWSSSLFSIGGAAVVGLVGLLSFRRNRMAHAPDARDESRHD
jgi:formate dehydrogenase iron-sulfur subunit